MLEHVLVDAPVFQFQLQHFKVVFLLLVKLPVVANKIDHHAEGPWLAINKNSVIRTFQEVTSGEHGLQRTSLHMAQCILAYFEVLVAAHIELYNIAEWLYLRDLLFLEFPRLSFVNKLLLLGLQVQAITLYCLDP